LAALAGACLTLANCNQTSGPFARAVDPKYGVSASERIVGEGDPVPKGGGTYRVGKPYQIAGQTYVPEENRSYTAEGLASWYGDDFHGRRTANGELYDMNGLSAAHPTLPMPSYVRVTNLGNKRSVIVRVNDRGPYHRNRLIDVSQKTAHLLGFHGNGVARVRVEYVGQAALEGSDDKLLETTLRQGGEPAPAPSAVRVASARPFIVQASHTPSVRGDIPMPESRPYTLGDETAANAAPTRTLSPAAAQAHAPQMTAPKYAAAKPPSAKYAEPQYAKPQQAAQISPAVSRQPDMDQSASLMPRSLGEQAQSLGSGSGFAPRESGMGYASQPLPPAAAAYAPPGRATTARGLY
jgi:rare lipoprotein A